MQQAGEKVVPIGYLDDNPELVGRRLLSLPVLGQIAELTAISHDAAIVAIGDNTVRRRLFEKMQSQGETFAIARHPSAVIAPDVKVDVGSMICAGVVVNTGSLVGANVILNTGCTVDHHNRIGDHTHIAPGVHLGGDVSIGCGTLIGIGSTVMPQRAVGSWSVVSAGALVHSNLADKTVAAGVPARAIRKLVAQG
jgi:sugar O-acyltransferase (sialic acid O-acetyltransferase NeuD family)